jgi:hypothetical protein
MNRDKLIEFLRANANVWELDGVYGADWSRWEGTSTMSPDEAIKTLAHYIHADEAQLDKLKQALN